MARGTKSETEAPRDTSGAPRDSSSSSSNGHSPPEDRRSLKAADRITTAADMANLMSALMYDVLAGTVTPGEASAVINAGRQTLRLVELSLRYEVSGGTPLLSIHAEATRRGKKE